MNNPELISIVLPVYNGEAYLEESIKSILRQTYSCFELIIVNDCSTDMTETIIRRYMEEDDRIILISNCENQRLPKSLNIGFAVSKGQYLTWTSDDNLYYPEALEKMVNYLKCHKEDGLVYADMNLIDETGRIIGCRKSREGDYYKYNCIGACFLYTKECRTKIGEYNLERILVEDYDYWLRIAQYYGVGHIEEFLYEYRIHPNSLSSTKMYEVGKRLADLKIEHFSSICKNIDEEEILPLLFEIEVYSEGYYNTLIQEWWTRVGKEIDWVKTRKKSIEDRVWLFGAGAIGIDAIHKLGSDKVLGFIDNNISKIGFSIENKMINSLDYYLENGGNKTIIISTDVRSAYYICKQLRENKIYNFVLFYDLLKEF